MVRLLEIGILLLYLAFQLITLPVEIDTSHRTISDPRSKTALWRSGIASAKKSRGRSTYLCNTRRRSATGSMIPGLDGMMTEKNEKTGRIKSKYETDTPISNGQVTMETPCHRQACICCSQV